MTDWKDVKRVRVSPQLRRLVEPDAPPAPLEPAAMGAHEPDPPRSYAVIGETSMGGSEVWFDPDWPIERLANAHISITGESGSGKTQGMKNLMAELSAFGIHSLALDFKDDYADSEYAKREGFSVYDPTHNPLPLNPLVPSADPQTGQVNKVFHAYQVAEIVARIYGLGEVQAFRLREAIKAVYESHPDAYPTFDDVRDYLAVNKENRELLGRLSPMFDFGFFSDAKATEFGRIVDGGNTTVRLGQLPSNEVKNSVAEFFLMALYNHLIRKSQVHTLRQILVLDEAWRVVNSPFLEPLMREGRAFGLGVFVATQFPTDLPLAVSGSTATQLFFSQSNPDQIRQIEETISGHTSGLVADSIGDIVRDMPPLHCVVFNKQYSPYVEVKARAYFERTQKTTAQVTGPFRSISNPCKHCDGTGRARDMDDPRTDAWGTCPRCMGRRRERDANCPGCGGPMYKADAAIDMQTGQQVDISIYECHRCRNAYTKEAASAIVPNNDELAAKWEAQNPYDAQGKPEGIGDQDVDGKYICQCGFSTDNDADELGRHVCNYCKAVGNLTGQNYGDKTAGKDSSMAHHLADVHHLGDLDLAALYERHPQLEWEAALDAGHRFDHDNPDPETEPHTHDELPDYDDPRGFRPVKWKEAELQPFPPGRDEEEDWMFPYSIQDQFVRGPQGPRRNANATTNTPVSVTLTSPQEEDEGGGTVQASGLSVRSQTA